MVWVLRVMTLAIAAYGIVRYGQSGDAWPWFVLVIVGGLLFGGSFSRQQKPKNKP